MVRFIRCPAPRLGVGRIQTREFPDIGLLYKAPSILTFTSTSMASEEPPSTDLITLTRYFNSF